MGFGWYSWGLKNGGRRTEKGGKLDFDSVFWFWLSDSVLGKNQCNSMLGCSIRVKIYNISIWFLEFSNLIFFSLALCNSILHIVLFNFQIDNLNFGVNRW